MCEKGTKALDLEKAHVDETMPSFIPATSMVSS